MSTRGESEQDGAIEITEIIVGSRTIEEEMNIERDLINEHGEDTQKRDSGDELGLGERLTPR